MRFLCLIFLLCFSQNLCRVCEYINKYISLVRCQFFLIRLILGFCLQLVSRQTISRSQNGLGQRLIVLLQRFLANSAAAFSRFSSDFSISAFVFLMEGPDVFHLFSIFILDKNIEKFVFSDSPPTNGLVVKPEIRHLIDFFFDHYQNVLLKVGENLILFGKWFISAEFGRRTVFTFAFASVDFIAR